MADERAAFVLAFAALQVPWAVRNYRVFGDPIVTTTLGGFNLYRHNGMIEEGKYHTGYSHPEMERRIRRLTEATGRPLESFNEAELNALLKAEGARIVRTYPGAIPQAVGDAHACGSGTTRIPDAGCTPSRTS